MYYYSCSYPKTKTSRNALEGVIEQNS